MAKPKTAVTTVQETTQEVVNAVKVELDKFLPPALQAELSVLAWDVFVVAADAALVKVSTGVEDLTLGAFKGVIVQVVQVGVRELRNALHGGNVSDGTVVEAVQPPVE